MKLDSPNFGTRKLPFGVNVVNVIVLDGTEHGAHAPANSGLLAVVNRVVPDRVRTHILLVPPIAKRSENNFNVILTKSAVSPPPTTVVAHELATA